MKSGMVLIYRSSSSTSDGAISINENADPSVRVDFEASCKRFGKPCLLNSMFGQSLTIPVMNGKFVFGTWQGIYLMHWKREVVQHDLVVVGCSSENDLVSTVFTAPHRGCHVVDEFVKAKLLNSNSNGFCCLLTKHTSASLSLADLGIGVCLEKTLSTVVPESWNREFFTHIFEGDDDMPGHLKSSIMGCNELVPVKNGSLYLGSKQISLYLNEHRDCGGWGGGNNRKIACVFFNESSFPFSSLCKNINVDVRENGVLEITETIMNMENFENGSTGVMSIVVASKNVAITMSNRNSCFESKNASMGVALRESFLSIGNSTGRNNMGIALCGKSITLPIVNGKIDLGSRTIWLLSVEKMLSKIDLIINVVASKNKLV
eukprot:g2953.t1